jgi:cytidylate kinase
MTKTKKITIAIDGFSSCGKSTLAKALAKKINYIFIDSGAMYRGVSLYCIDNNLTINNEINESLLIKHLPLIELSYKINENTMSPELILNGENVENKIRRIEVASIVSKVASIKEVRQKLVLEQQKMGEFGGIVMDGRDIGSVVFPTAELKLFITADPETRAQRRYKELKEKGDIVTLEEISVNLEERDRIDSTRKESPLLQTKDAILLDNSTFTPDEQLDIVYNLYLNKVNEIVLQTNP